MTTTNSVELNRADRVAGIVPGLTRTERASNLDQEQLRQLIGLGRELEA